MSDHEVSPNCQCYPVDLIFPYASVHNKSVIMSVLVKSLYLNLALLQQIFLELSVIKFVLLYAPMHHIHVSLTRLNLDLLDH